MTHLLHAGASVLLRPGHGVATGPPQSELVDVERGAVAVHQDHRGGEVEPARGQDPDGSPGIKRLARRHSRGVEVVTSARQHQNREQRHGHDPRHAYDGDAALEQEQRRTGTWRTCQVEL